MNPWDLDATGLLVWGVVAHLIADWPLQNDWMAKHKAARRTRGRYEQFGPPGRRVESTAWYDRHPAAYVHAGIHGVLLAFVFGWVALPLAVAHLLIDTRKPVAWFSRLVRQTQPGPVARWESKGMGYDGVIAERVDGPVLVDVGLEVRFWTDQVWHVVCVALAALATAA